MYFHSIFSQSPSIQYSNDDVKTRRIVADNIEVREHFGVLIAVPGRR